MSRIINKKKEKEVLKRVRKWTSKEGSKAAVGLWLHLLRDLSRYKLMSFTSS
jgi:hypothetical protein